MNYLILFPHNLFPKKQLLKFIPKDIDIDKLTIILVEDPLFFGDKERIKNYTKLKLVLHRASMKYYKDYLKEEVKPKSIKYIEYSKAKKYSYLKKINDKKIYLFDPCDHLLMKRINKIVEPTVLDSPLFLLSIKDLEEYNETKQKSNTFFHKHFYDWQLKKNPGGIKIPYITKSYDEENRKPPTKNLNVPTSIREKINDNNTEYVKEAKKYIENNFKNNYGNVEDFFFPITHKTSNKWLKDFVKVRLKNFGTYQDAILQNEPFMFHSLLSTMINVGLLTPHEVLEEVIEYYEKNKKEVKINNYEGFVRQLIGWREYERMLYVLDYDNLTSSNYFGNKKLLNKKWYTGKTGIKPIDDTINKAFKNGYLHHIERLMVMLNFMNLARIHPKQIYNWFMEFSCDAYDWVMVGNVYGMGYFSTNTMRKPYLSTSNYIRQMTDYKNDGHWNEVWDALFYKFLTDNKPKLKGGAAVYLRNLVHFEKKSSKEKKEIFEKIKF